MQEVRARDYANKSAKITARIPAKLHKSRAILQTTLGPYTLVHPVSSHGNRGGEGFEKAPMARTLSSAQTFVMKAIFPVVWIAGFGAGTLMVWRARLQTAAQSLPPPEWKWLFLGGFVCGGAFIVRTCVPLKRVRLTQDTLLISNYWREIRVPLRDVHDVTESRWINIHPVPLHLRHPTAFGSRVVFMPQTRWFGSGWPHPIVEELRRLVQQARL